jgi:hypothetical protein
VQPANPLLFPESVAVNRQSSHAAFLKCNIPATDSRSKIVEYSQSSGFAVLDNVPHIIGRVTLKFDGWSFGIVAFAQSFCACGFRGVE